MKEAAFGLMASHPRKRMKLSSVQIIALGFFLMIALGTGLLMLPISSQGPGHASFGDALFTATSASCVTGLVMRDTGTYWTTFGQLVIIVLIQIGGLGFMTIATLFSLLLRRRMGLREREVVVEGTTMVFIQTSAPINFGNSGWDISPIFSRRRAPRLR